MILENIVKEERDLIKLSEMKAIQQNKKIARRMNSPDNVAQNSALRTSLPLNPAFVSFFCSFLNSLLDMSLLT